MDERIKQSISALMDDEVNELELQRVLAHLDDEDISDVWQRYHQVRDIMKGEAFIQDSRPAFNIDVSQSVSEWIEQSEVEDTSEMDVRPVENKASGHHLSRFGGLMALAASVVFAVVFVIQNDASHSSSYPLLAQTTESSFEPVVNHASRQPKIVDQINEQQARRLNQYLLRHAEHSMLGARQGAMPFVRVASVNSVGI